MSAPEPWVPKKPFIPGEHPDQRHFCSKEKWLVDTDNQNYATFGATVYRNAQQDKAQLQIHGDSNLIVNTTLNLRVPALVELAHRLLDAAHDLGENPAPAKEPPCFSK